LKPGPNKFTTKYTKSTKQTPAIKCFVFLVFFVVICLRIMPPTDPNTELAELAGGFIHELKNHLGTLGMNLQLLAEDLQSPQSPRERRILDRVVRLEHECKRLGEMANDFLRFARLGELNRQPVRLGELIDEMIDFFGPQARTANIEIKTFIPTDLPAVSLDPQLFKQALLNLMLNAEQALGQGGQLTFQARKEGDQVRLDLIDTGSGMSLEDQKKIFKPFYSTRPGGTGLGLATTRRIIERHGGRIEVQSEPGRGTQFTIWLPVQ